MIFLLLLHFNGLIFALPDQKSIHDETFLSVSRLFLESATIITVNCFILITGFFGTRFSISKIGNLYFQSVFYSIIALFLSLFMGNTFTFKSLTKVFLLFSNERLWFITAYIGLLCCTPLLNRALLGCKRGDLLKILYLLTFINVYLGFFRRNEVNLNGFSVMQFLYLYCIGRYIGKFVKFEVCRVNRYKLMMCYLTFTILSVVVAYEIINRDHYNYLFLVYLYNNPINILSSISFFMIFLSFTMKSKIVDNIAKSTLAIYIFHMCLWDEISYIVRWLYGNFSKPLFLFYSLILLLSIYILSIAIDKSKIYIYNNIRLIISKQSERKKNGLS